MSEMNSTRLMGFLQDNTQREVQFEIGDHTMQRSICVSAATMSFKGKAAAFRRRE